MTDVVILLWLEFVGTSVPKKKKKLLVHSGRLSQWDKSKQNLTALGWALPLHPKH